jgi:fibronectin-binding autotransporter adhesin
VNLEVNQNSTNVLLRFNIQITTSGSGGGINKNGAGAIELYRVNSFGNGVNINAGTVALWNQGSAAGTGAITLGAADGAAAATLAAGGQNAGGQTFANAITVNAGDGARTIRNYDTGLIPTLSGNITLNKDVTFQVDDLGENKNLLISSGQISGDHGIVKNGSGALALTGSNTFTGSTTVNGGGAGFVRISADAGLGAAPASATSSHLVLNDGGLNTAASFTLSANRGIELSGSGGLIFTDTGTELTYDGIMAGTNFQKAGTGVLTLGGDNTYAGVTQVLAGGLIVNGTHAGAGLATVSGTARIGGTGSLAGDLTILSDGLFVFNPDDPTLNVVGAVTLDDTFSVASLVNLDGTAINWDSVANGIYTLIGTTASSFSNITNFGDNNPYDIGGGRSAYFQDGSLNLVVVPEPSTFALLGGVAAVGVFMMRRRRTIG